MPEKQEKKVEYVELIYDLIFVYLIGQNNALLEKLEGGFFSFPTYRTYIFSTLVVLQVWYFSTLFINRYGCNSLSDHIGLFVNMYLLYYLGQVIRVEWFAHYAGFCAAWGLILLNLSCQYFLQLKKRPDRTFIEQWHIRLHGRVLLAQAAAILVSIPLYGLLNKPLSWIVLLAGMAGAVLMAPIESRFPVNFEHLTERVMLYVVFTFGEMIVGIAGYFDGGLSIRSLYFSLLAFLIVVGLLSIYGYLYDHIIDRQRVTTGSRYMLIHVGLIFALSNITAALGFMRDPEAAELPKNVYLVISILAYFFILFHLNLYAKPAFRTGRVESLRLFLAAAAFALLTALSYRNGMVSIAVTAAYVWSMFLLIWQHCRSAEE